MNTAEKEEQRRAEVVKNAIEAADGIIMEGSSGTVEETNYLTAAVVSGLMKCLLAPLQGVVLREDMKQTTGG